MNAAVTHATSEYDTDVTGCFLAAPFPFNEAQRVDALQSYGILDSAAEQAFDDIAKLAALCCDMPIALLSLVDTDRQWFKSRVGIEVEGTPRDISFCSHAILQPSDVMIVPDAREDVRFAGNPLVRAEDGIVFYAGAPLVTPTGEAIGTLCIADHRPRELTHLQILMLRGLASQAMAQLELRRSLSTLENAIESQARYVNELESQQVELEENKAKLEHENATDVLTNLGNRRAFQARLEEEFVRARRTGTTMALVVLDVDCFKRYNDSFGHPAGDQVLKQLSGVLSRTCRNYDFAARVGGEEFAVILPGATQQSAFVIAERLRRNVQREVWPNRPVTISVGVTLMDNASDTVHSVLERADRALYSSKNDGRNRVTMSGGSPEGVLE